LFNAFFTMPLTSDLYRSEREGLKQGWIQPVMLIKSHMGFSAVREMKYTSHHCCDKTMDERMAFNREHWDNSNMTKDLFEFGLICWFPNCKKSLWITLLTWVLGAERPSVNPSLTWSKWRWGFSFYGVETWLLLRIICEWNKIPEPIFQITRGQWGSQ